MPQLPIGFDECNRETELVRSRKNLFFIFTINPANPLTYTKLYTKPNNIQKNLRDIIPRDEAVNIFDELKGYIKKNPNLGCFVVYDFPFYSSEKFLGSIITLFSYVPEKLSPLINVAFSTSILNLPAQLNVSKHISLHHLNELEYFELHEKVAERKKN